MKKFGCKKYLLHETYELLFLKSVVLPCLVVVSVSYHI